MTAPVAVDSHAGWVDEWYCAPPAEDETFVVVRSEWDESYLVRRIYEWRRP